MLRGVTIINPVSARYITTGLTSVDLSNPDAIAELLGVPFHELRWLRHSVHIFVGCATGQVFHYSGCPSHNITLRGRTIVIRLPDNLWAEQHVHPGQAVDIELEEAVDFKNHVAPGEGKYELRPITQPLVNLEYETAQQQETDKAEAIGNALSLLFGHSVKVLSGAELPDFLAQLSGDDEAARDLALDVQLPFTWGQDFPNAFDTSIECLQQWANSIADPQLVLDRQLKNKHIAFSMALIQHMTDFLVSNRQSYEELGGDYETMLGNFTKETQQ